MTILCIIMYDGYEPLSSCVDYCEQIFNLITVATLRDFIQSCKSMLITTGTVIIHS